MMKCCLTVSILLAFVMCWPAGAIAQEKQEQQETKKSAAEKADTEKLKVEPFQLQYTDAEVQKYEFGIRIECNGGYAQSVTANAPIPIAWPEQEVELYEETKSNNIKKIRTKSLPGKTASIMAFAVPRMNNGDFAEAVLRYRVKRRSTIRPDDTDQFAFAKKLTSKMKKAYLKPSPYIESDEKRIKEISKKIFEDNADLPAWDQVEAAYSWVRENVAYEFDKLPRSLLEALDNGHGDCEELSGLFIAICRSHGVPARAVWVPGHTYPEFYLVDEAGTGHWFPCQAAGQRHEFGEISEDRPILQKGDRFKTPVNKEWKRYVEAGLNAANATGALKAEHLMHEVADE